MVRENPSYPISRIPIWIRLLHGSSIPMHLILSKN